MYNYNSRTPYMVKYGFTLAKYTTILFPKQNNNKTRNKVSGFSD